MVDDLRPPAGSLIGSNAGSLDGRRTEACQESSGKIARAVPRGRWPVAGPVLMAQLS